MKTAKRWMVVVVCAGLALMTGCGSGSGAGNNAVGGSGAQPRVVVAPSTALVLPGSTQQFSASGGNMDVLGWAVNGVMGGNDTIGTISATGLYTAPAVVTTLNGVTVSLVSSFDGSTAASAVVNFQAPVGTSLSISPQNSRVLVGGTVRFTSSVAGVTWQVSGTDGGNETTGTISPDGVYTAPAVVPSSPVVAVNVRTAGGNVSPASYVNIGAPSSNPYAYVSSAGDDSIQSFAADVKTGTLKALATYPMGTGTGPTGLAVSRNGKYLYSLNRGTNDISIFGIDAATGGLSSAGRVATAKGPYAMVFSAKGDFAYVSCDGASTIEVFALNLTTGALNLVNGASYVAGGGRIQSLAIADGGYLYAVNRDASQIVGFAINAVDGSLTALAGSPYGTGSGVTSMVIAAGDVYVADDKGVESFYIGSTGDLGVRKSPDDANFGASAVLIANVPFYGLVGANPQSGGAYVRAVDWLGGSGNTYRAGTGVSPVAGGWMWSGSASSNWLFVLNQQEEAAATTGSITSYQFSESGMKGPMSMVPIELHHATGFVITP